MVIKGRFKKFGAGGNIDPDREKGHDWEERHRGVITSEKVQQSERAHGPRNL